MDRLFLYVSTVFFLSYFLGIYTSIQLADQIHAGNLEPAFENPGDINNIWYIFTLILVGTGILFVIIKLYKKLLKVLEGIVIFFTTQLVLAAFLINVPEIVAYFISISFALALALKQVLKPTILSQNISVVFITAGAASVLGVSLTPGICFLIMFLLSCYDFIAVFLTKHMIYLAKEIIDKPYSLVAAFPAENIKTQGKNFKKIKQKAHIFHLGAGDIAIPLLFTCSLLAYEGIIASIFSTFFTFVSLSLLFLFMRKRVGIALPALPVVCAGASLGYLVFSLIF
ncbi:MAG: presenilin family intramembrane aspartyl protease [archaeon]